MPYEVHTVTPKPILRVGVLDADHGRPRLMTVHTGEAVLIRAEGGPDHATPRGPDHAADGGPDHAAARRESVGFFIPDAGAIDGAEPPQAWAEVWLCAFVVDAPSAGRDLPGAYSVSDATVGYPDDSRGGPSHWPYLRLMCVAPSQVRLGYRVTLVQPPAARRPDAGSPPDPTSVF